LQAVRQIIRDFALPIAVAIALALVIQAAIAKPYEIPTESMVPTIQQKDRVIANRLVYLVREPKQGDVIVFQPTLAARISCGAANNGIPFVKRVVGVPGDRVQIRSSDGLTLVNGTPFVEKRAARPDYDFPVDTAQSGSTLTVPPDRLFVLGDNRNRSCDSHMWSDHFVHRDAVIGQAEVIYWPPGDWTFLG
jgi:signal peptidase I